jgi:hypothetical protein
MIMGALCITIVVKNFWMVFDCDEITWREMINL